MSVLESDPYLRALVQAELPGATVCLLPLLEGSENRHAEISVGYDGRVLFAKFYSSRKKYRVEAAVLRALAQRYDWPILPVTGSDSGEVAWHAFPFVPLTEVPASQQTFREWGMRLAEVHLCTPPDGLDVSGRAVDRVDERLDKLRALRGLPVVDEAESVAAELWQRARGSLGEQARQHQTSARLITNDFGLRNTYRMPSGVMTLIDFERAGVGDPHWELGKAWDRELREPADAAVFLDGYRARLGGGQDWPHPPTLWVTRFVAALAAIPYALRVGDEPFLHHAVAMLARLRDELELVPDAVKNNDRVRVTGHTRWSGTEGGLRDWPSLTWESGQHYRGWGRKGYSEELAEFAACVRAGRQPDASLAAHAASLGLTERIIAALAP